MPDTTNQPTCTVCGGLEYLTPLDSEQGEWICFDCDAKNGAEMPRIIGIDPGKSGGIAIIEGDDVATHNMPETPYDLWQLLASCEPATVWIEKVNAGPKMASRAAFTFGYGVGAIDVACLAAGLRIERVSPVVWQRGVGIPTSKKQLGVDDTAKKNINKARAQELFPGIKVTHKTADALLLAEYGRRKQ